VIGPFDFDFGVGGGPGGFVFIVGTDRQDRECEGHEGKKPGSEKRATHGESPVTILWTGTDASLLYQTPTERSNWNWTESASCAVWGIHETALAAGR
jgi:hypothetical protein